PRSRPLPRPKAPDPTAVARGHSGPISGPGADATDRMPTHLFERSRRGEHALLIQPHAGGPPDEGALEEFTELARSAGATIAHVMPARIDRPNAATLLGSGKLEEVKAAADATGADLVLVNHALTPGQERNLEKLLERRVVDRTGLILDIFAQRARSHEGKLQVELAQLKHMATRLVRGWTHLERQRGGSIGLRGPGETQLETDRRLLQKRVDALQKRLAKVEVQRTQMRRARVRSELPRVALVGYTNAGKSTLFNALTGADAYAADQLFATLDPTVRRISLPGGSVVLADTVGFVRDLPHELVAAFRSTLSEARAAAAAGVQQDRPDRGRRTAPRPCRRRGGRARTPRAGLAFGPRRPRPGAAAGRPGPAPGPAARHRRAALAACCRPPACPAPCP